MESAAGAGTIIEEHLAATGSAKAAAILDDWDAYLPKFVHVYPTSEAEAPEVSGRQVVIEEKEAVAA